MSIELTPDLQAYVDEQVRQGHFLSTADVVAEALQRMKDSPADDELSDPALWASLEESERQIEQGQVMDWETTEATLRKKFGL